MEGYSSYAFPPQGNGSTFILPEYSGDSPQGESFDCYIYGLDGREYYPGDEIVYPYADRPFGIRGGVYDSAEDAAGMFRFGRTSGSNGENYAFRTVMF